jgi:hypothetical protein
MLGFRPFVEIASKPGKVFGASDSLIPELVEQSNCWPVYSPTE